MNISTCADGNRLLSRRKAAEILGVSVRTVCRYERQGRLPACKLSSRLTRYRLQDLDKLIGDAAVKQGRV